MKKSVTKFNDMKYADLGYLEQRTKNNTAMILEMIAVFLVQTPALISDMKKSLLDKDWISLRTCIHKLLPSFFIMGISPKTENVAKKLQESLRLQPGSSGIEEMVIQIETVCLLACKELEDEFQRIKNAQ